MTTNERDDVLDACDDELMRFGLQHFRVASRNLGLLAADGNHRRSQDISSLKSAEHQALKACFVPSILLRNGRIVRGRGMALHY